MLSSSHPMHDVCGELAKADFYGLDPGGYSAGERPFVPHQNRNVGGIVAVILRLACNYTGGRTVIAEVEFDATGKGTIRRADDSYIREALEEALATPIEYETGMFKCGVLASVPVVAQPGTPRHARAMCGSHFLISKGMICIGVEGEPLEIRD